MKALEIATIAREAVAVVTGRAPEVVSACEKNGDRWIVLVEVLDTKARMTDNDIIATYQLDFDDLGELHRYERTRRYTRGRGTNLAA